MQNTGFLVAHSNCSLLVFLVMLFQPGAYPLFLEQHHFHALTHHTHTHTHSRSRSHFEYMPNRVSLSLYYLS